MNSNKVVQSIEFGKPQGHLYLPSINLSNIFSYDVEKLTLKIKIFNVCTQLTSIFLPDETISILGKPLLRSPKFRITKFPKVRVLIYWNTGRKLEIGLRKDQLCTFNQ